VQTGSTWSSTRDLTTITIPEPRAWLLARIDRLRKMSAARPDGLGDREKLFIPPAEIIATPNSSWMTTWHASARTGAGKGRLPDWNICSSMSHQEAAYNSLLIEKREFHCRVGEALKASFRADRAVPGAAGI
jgi:hypothetical protein